MRETRPTYKKLSALDRVKSTCRAYSNVLLRRGHLKRELCVVCGSAAAQMHHPDYGRPRNVVWMCAPCHRALHNKGGLCH
jgi:hypothetical protein